MRRLSSQIFVAELVILTMTMLVGFLLSIRHERAQLDSEYENRAAAIAETTAQLPDIRRCMQHETSGCATTIQQLATTVAANTGASYVVIIDMNRVRHSHPNPSLIGQQVAEPIVVADGRVHVGSDHGNTGPSANGKAPLRGLDGTLVGEVSVGLNESTVSMPWGTRSRPTPRGSASRWGSAPWRPGSWPATSNDERSAWSSRRSRCCCKNARPPCTGSAKASSPSTSTGGYRW